MPASDTTGAHTKHDIDLSGLDALELPSGPKVGRLQRVWETTWPMAAATAIFFGLWQAIVWTHWKPDFILVPPGTVLKTLFSELTAPAQSIQENATGQDTRLIVAIRTTLGRAGTGFGLSVVLGTLVGMAVAASRHLRRAIGSLITGLQTMPSIAWFPLAILLFRGEAAILFVVVLGAAPAIANGILAGIDHIPPVLLRAGRVMGARGVSAVRHVIFPAALPGYVAGLKQGWAFAWRSLMAAELLNGAIGNSIGAKLQLAREIAGYDQLFATMIVILVIGIAVDAAIFDTLGRLVRRRRGLQVS